MPAQYGYDSITATGRYSLAPDRTGGDVDNVAVVQVGGGTWSATATIQGNPFSAVQDPNNNGWQNIATVRLDTLAIEQTPTMTSNTARSWMFNCAGFQQVALNVTVMTGSIPFNLVSYFQANGVPLQIASALSGNQAVTGTMTVTSSSANALAVGPNGATNPTLQIDGSTSSAATGLKIKSAAAASGLALSVVSSGTDEALTVDAKGTGTITFGATSTGAIQFSRAAVPTASDGAALGTSSLMWSDLFLASGGVINFNNGDITVTHSANVLAFAGGSYTFDGAVTQASNDGGALGSASVGWSDLFLATGGVINWANGEVTLTETDANTLTLAGATAVNLGAITMNVTGTRWVQSYHTNLTSTNAVTVDSSERVKEDVTAYDGDALATVNAMDVITYSHDTRLDPSGATKLGIRAESINESLAVDTIRSQEFGDYPGVNTYALAALHTRALQQLSREVAELRAAMAN